MAGPGLAGSGLPYDEASALEAGGRAFERGFELMKSFLKI